MSLSIDTFRMNLRKLTLKVFYLCAFTFSLRKKKKCSLKIIPNIFCILEVNGVSFTFFVFLFLGVNAQAIEILFHFSPSFHFFRAFHFFCKLSATVATEMPANIKYLRNNTTKTDMAAANIRIVAAANP